MSVPDFFQIANAEYIERLYQQYLTKPESLDETWLAFFWGLEIGAEQPIRGSAHGTNERRSGHQPDVATGAADLVHSYRELGHFQAQLDPLGDERPPQPLLELSEFGFSNDDLERQVGAGGFLCTTDGTLRDLVEKLRSAYCGTIGVEYMDIADPTQRAWLQERMEPVLNRAALSADECRQILWLLVAAQGFEEFLHTKYIGQKRFSLEGAESLIPLLETLIEVGASLGAKEIVMGASHRGRLNVLAHVLGKPYELIFGEFEGTQWPNDEAGDGDVKYHLGYSHDRVTAAGRKIHCSLCPNPSHLELIDPVVEGIVRAKQHYLGDTDRTQVVPILLHGEAAFTGQGLVPETLNLSELEAYRTGGTIHVIINNQLGFTATPPQTRFTPYPTDVAKMIRAPIFHVNADDPEAVVHAARLAMSFRQRFKVDVMIDLQCLRKHGHNEGDDPTFTQPLLYRKISQHTSVRDAYSRQLTSRGILSQADYERMRQELRDHLESALTFAREFQPRQRVNAFGGVWKGLGRAGRDWAAHTAVEPDVLSRITKAAGQLPAGFAPHPKIERLLTARDEMVRGAQPVDWGCAEMLAIGSLLLEGTHVRFTGQDSERGTFSHRHAVLHDTKTGSEYVPLAHLNGLSRGRGQAQFTIVNTMLSELAVVGYEYGFSCADPRNLVIWEAQFGDFANGAQPFIDQFIVSAESKWQRMSALVLLLPHGYEGQGPEHSSARLERFLQLCAEDNIQVCQPSNSAQYFHVLRRQIHRQFRKPLVLFMPKSLLRDDRSASAIEEFSSGGFRLVIDDPASPARDQVRRLLICSGKVHFTLTAARDKHRMEHCAVVRIEQLYPFPKPELQAILARYRRAHEVCWVQEEPRNMGAWQFVESRLRDILPDTCVFSYYGRDAAASPACGSSQLHHREEDEFVSAALELDHANAPVT